jgi:hypothetical protein
MKDNKIIIPKPCNEGWNTMSPKDNGRHCDSCNKVVVDFTSMSLEEIKVYFDNNTGTKICGHFKAIHVEANRPTFHKYLISLYEYLDEKISIHLFRTISLSIVALCMTIVGCQNRTEGEKTQNENCRQSEQHLTGDTIHIKQDNNAMIDGEVSIIEVHDSIKKQK